MKDPIVEGVRKAREKHAKEFNHDLSAICTDLKRIEQECGRRLVSFPPKLLPKTSRREVHKVTAYNEWLAAEIQEAIDDPRSSIPHDEVMAEMDAEIATMMTGIGRRIVRAEGEAQQTP